MRYIPTRVPEDVHKLIIDKKIKLEQIGRDMTGHPVRIPITRVIRIISSSEINIPQKKLKRIFQGRE